MPGAVADRDAMALGLQLLRRARSKQSPCAGTRRGVSRMGSSGSSGFSVTRRAGEMCSSRLFAPFRVFGFCPFRGQSRFPPERSGPRARNATHFVEPLDGCRRQHSRIWPDFLGIFMSRPRPRFSDASPPRLCSVKKCKGLDPGNVLDRSTISAWTGRIALGRHDGKLKDSWRDPRATRGAGSQR